VLPAPVPVSWSFRVDEIATPGPKDGTSNTISDHQLGSIGFEMATIADSALP